MMTLDLMCRKNPGLLSNVRTLYQRLDMTVLPPVSTPPPRFLSFGMPPANKPANCGGCSIPVAPLVSLPLWSLLLRALLPAPGGFSPPPGTGGAPPNGDGLEPPVTFPTIGADRSFVTAFLSCLPFEMSDNKAPYE